ncbi:Uncharacterised protein [Porphyromonas macacae]|uniref:DUF7033 domain-containing protein n=2 Tax=Porphyromonas macacae TaxID=28115 RepID=A0A379E7I5_9PORP|nr:hypothetical protein [Porphyromonas macacae]SUB88655.1 Uncharacterised protein [Porphyromonas macacae]
MQALEMIDNSTIRYLIRFVTNLNVSDENGLSATRLIGYTDNPQEMLQYRIVIKPSGFFKIGNYGTEASFPVLPLKKWHGIPILFGEGDDHDKPADIYPVEGQGKYPVIIQADLIAGAYFLISRYEEIYKRKIRDSHGRFPGKESIPFKGNFIHRPVIDEYGRELRRMLRQLGVPLEEETAPHVFSRIYLTHNIFSPFCQNRRTECFEHFKHRVFLLFKRWAARANLRYHENEISSTKFLEWDRSVGKHFAKGSVKTIFFMLTPGHSNENKRIHRLTHYTNRFLRKAILRYRVVVGLSCNKECCLHPELISKARKQLKTQFGVWTQYGRFEYLAAREPEDFIALYESGIRHDFSMGYFDVPGFRLGTARPVYFINPSLGKLTDLLIHPLTISDRSLSDHDGMRMTYEEALGYAQGLVKKVAEVNGELVLSWHSDLLNKENHEYHSRLYRDLLRLIIDLEEKYQETLNAHSAGNQPYAQ